MNCRSSQTTAALPRAVQRKRARALPCPRRLSVETYSQCVRPYPRPCPCEPQVIRGVVQDIPTAKQPGAAVFSSACFRRVLGRRIFSIEHIRSICFGRSVRNAPSRGDRCRSGCTVERQKSSCIAAQRNARIALFCRPVTKLSCSSEAIWALIHSNACVVRPRCALFSFDKKGTARATLRSSGGSAWVR